MSNVNEYVVRTILDVDATRGDAAVTALGTKLDRLQSSSSKSVTVAVETTGLPLLERLGPLLDTTSAGAERLAHSMQLAGQANDGLGLAISRVKDGPDAFASAARAEDTLAASTIRATAAHQALREAMASDDVDRIAAATQRAARAEDDLARAAMRAAAEQSAGRAASWNLGGALAASNHGPAALAAHFEPNAADAYANAVQRAHVAQSQLDHVMQTGESEAGQLAAATERAAKAYGDLQHAASRASGAIEHATHAEQQASQERLAGIAQGANAASGIVGGLLARTLQYGTMVAGAVAAGVGSGFLRGAQLAAANGETQIAIAGMFTAGGASSSFENSMLVAGSVMSRIRRDAAALPGEANDYVAIFRAAAPQLLRAGARDPDKMTSFTDHVGAVGITMGIDPGQIGRDLNLMLGGRAGAQVNTWNALASNIATAGHELHKSAVSAEQFNALRPEDRLAVMERAISKYDSMVEAFGHTWSSVGGGLRSTIDHLLEVASKPLLDAAVDNGLRFSGWLDRASLKLERLATTVGTRLAPFLNRGADFLIRIGDRLANMSFDQLAASADRLVHKLAAGLTLLVGMKASLGLVAGTANFLASPLGKMALARMGGGAAAGIAGAEAGGLLAGGAAAAALGTGALVGGAVVGAGAVATAGAVNAGWIGAQDMILLKDAAGLLVSGLHMLWDAVSPVVGVFGFLLVRAVEGLALGIGGLVYWIGWAADQIRGAVGGAVNWLLDHVPGLRTATNYLLMRDGPERATERGVHVPGGPTANAEAALHRAGTRLNAQKQGKMQVNVKLETTINDASDPDRVYYMVRRATQDAIRAPILSAMLPVVH